MIFFTADCHFHHANIIRYCDRPFASVEEQDRNLEDNWNATVGKDDEIWVLGDFSFCDPVPILARLNGRKHLIRGNHDYKNNRSIKWEQPMVELKHGGRTLVLCHYPMVSWRASGHLQTIHLHGHSHGKYTHSKLAMDVGVDVNGFRPVSFDEVVRRMDAKRDELRRRYGDGHCPEYNEGVEQTTPAVDAGDSCAPYMEDDK